VLRFIEDNWSTGRIGDFSFDQLAGDIRPMFNFRVGKTASRLLLDPATGEVTHSHQ
jgi:phospholipase C